MTEAIQFCITHCSVMYPSESLISGGADLVGWWVIQGGSKWNCDGWFRFSGSFFFSYFFAVASMEGDSIMSWQMILLDWVWRRTWSVSNGKERKLHTNAAHMRANRFAAFGSIDRSIDDGNGQMVAKAETESLKSSVQKNVSVCERHHAWTHLATAAPCPDSRHIWPDEFRRDWTSPPAALPDSVSWI